MDTYSDKDKEFKVQLTSPSMISLPKEQTASQHNVTVSQLDIPDGLKELLISHDFLLLESILNISSAALADVLGIDQHVGEIISIAATKLQKQSCIIKIPDEITQESTEFSNSRYNIMTKVIVHMI